MPTANLRGAAVALVVLTLALWLASPPSGESSADGGPSSEIEWQIPGEAPVYGLDWQPGTHRLAAVVDSNRAGTPNVLSLDCASRREPRIMAGDYVMATAAACLPDDLVLVGTQNGHLYLQSKDRLQSLCPPPSGEEVAVCHLAVLPSGEFLVGREKQLELRTADGNLLWSIPRGGLTRFSLTRDGSRLACGTHTGEFLVIDTPTGSIVQTLQTGTANSVGAITSDGKFVLCGGMGGELTLWDVASGKPLWHQSNGQPISSIAVSPEGGHFAVGGFGTNVRLWSRWGGAGPTFQVGKVTCLKFSPDGSRLACGTGTGTLHIFRTELCRTRD